VRLLVDNALSPHVAELLRSLGQDAVHVKDLGLATADDPTILARARVDGRIVLSADTDFGTLLALAADPGPSVVLWRSATRRPAEQVPILVAVLEQFRSDLEAGAVLVIEDDRIRVRPLPIG